MSVKVGINGFGRIGRSILRSLLEKMNSKLEVVAVNDLTDSKTLAYLLKYDSNQGTFKGEVKDDGADLMVNGKKIKVLAEKSTGTCHGRTLGLKL